MNEADEKLLVAYLKSLSDYRDLCIKTARRTPDILRMYREHLIREAKVANKSLVRFYVHGYAVFL